MNNKQILIVSRSFYPMNTPRSFRTTELAKEFARQGHLVTVITHKDEVSHPSFEKEYGVRIKDLGKQSWKAVKLKGRGIEMLFRRMISRFSNLFFQYPDIELQWLVKEKLKKEEGYDLLISVAVPYPVHWGVAMVRSEKNPIAKVWVADCGDPFMGQENDSFTPPFYFKYIEKWFCRKADYISVPTSNSINAYYPEFHSKIKVIPQGFKFDDLKVKDFVNSPVPTFAYGGLFIKGRRDPSELLQYLSELNRDFRFHIYTRNASLVQPYLSKLDKRIILQDFVPRTELLYHLSGMDFVVNFENIGERQTPSKLIDYAILRKPILSIKTGELNKSVVNEFLEGEYSHQLVINNPDQYRIENVCKSFLNLVDNK